MTMKNSSTIIDEFNNLVRISETESTYDAILQASISLKRVCNAINMAEMATMSGNDCDTEVVCEFLHDLGDKAFILFEQIERLAKSVGVKASVKLGVAA